MTKADRDYRSLLIDTLTSIKDITAQNDVANDMSAMNKLVSTITFLEDILDPYKDMGEATKYNPVTTGDKYIDVHHRLRALMKIGKAVALLPPRRFVEDGEEFQLGPDQ
jgi:hypothetical protein